MKMSKRVCLVPSKGGGWILWFALCATTFLSVGANKPASGQVATSSNAKPNKAPSEGIASEKSAPLPSVRVASLSILPKKWDKEANSQKIERMVREAVEREARLVITPEGVLDGYVIEEIIQEQDRARKKELNRRFRELAEPIDGRYIKQFRQLSDELDVYLVLGFLEVDGRSLYNTAALLGPGGKLVGKYRKTHFAQGYDVNPPGYTPGNKYPVFDMGFMKLGMMICFDRTMPEPARLLALGGADLIACSAYGGYGELNRWRMRVRANENDVHVVFTHPQQSLIIDRAGTPLMEKTKPDTIVLSDIPIGTPTRINGRIRNRRPETFDGLNLPPANRREQERSARSLIDKYLSSFD